MRLGEDCLRGTTLSLEGLSDGFDLLANFGIFIDLGLKALKDLRINHRRGSHFGD